VGLNEAVRLDLDCTGDPPAHDPNQRRHAWRGQRAVGPLCVIRVLGPALRREELDQPIQVGSREWFDRGPRHPASGSSAKAIAFPPGSGTFVTRARTHRSRALGERSKQSSAIGQDSRSRYARAAVPCRS
jgi:hypothetical protein